MFTTILFALVLYILYRFIFGFVLPVISASRKMREKMREMQGNMQGFPPTQDSNVTGRSGSTSTGKSNAATPSSKDYIEFEEIK